MAYLYTHIRLDKNEPFYIGIGSDLKYQRANNKKGRSYSWKDIAYKAPYIVEITFDNISWDEACYEEIKLIKLYGRKDLGTGILTNLTDGGEGQYGRKISITTRIKMQKPKSNISKLNMKLSHKNRDYSYLKGKAGAKKGIKKSLEHKKNMSISRIGIPREKCDWIKTTPVLQYNLQCELIREFQSLKEACIFIGKPKGISNIINVCNGKHKKAYNYVWKYKQA